MWAQNQPVLISCFKPSLLSLSQHSSIPKNEELSPWSTRTNPAPHTWSLLWSCRPTGAAVFGSHLPETDRSADSERCLKNTYMFKPLGVTEAGGAQKAGMWSCDKDDNKAAEAIESPHIVCFPTGALITGIFTGRSLAVLCKFASCKTLSHMFRLLTFLFEWKEIWGFPLFLPRLNCIFIIPHSTFAVFITNTAHKDMRVIYPHHIKSVYTLGKLHIILYCGSLLGLAREDGPKCPHFGFHTSPSLSNTRYTGRNYNDARPGLAAVSRTFLWCRAEITFQCHV